MKNLLLIAISLLMISTNSFSQTNIQISINHKLGLEDFGVQKSSKNNLGHDFEVTRMEYYISEISIIHDGGTETLFDEFWALMDAERPTKIDLPESDIVTVEKLKFHIGVDPEHNHLDPASYPMFHPLAPTNPSMHWGWDPGYRFVAFEGNGGSNLDQVFELHGLGDDNYFLTEIELNETAIDNQIILNIDADYSRALENIEMNSGVIVHGEVLQAKQCLENFRDFVFSPASETSAIVDFSEVSKFAVFPNPSSGNATITIEAIRNLSYQVSITDILGKQVRFFDDVKSNSTIDFQLGNSGFYLINLIKEGHPIITKILISK